MGSSNSRQRSNMPVSRSVSSIPQRRICTIWLNTSRHLVLPVGRVWLFFHCSQSDKSSRIPPSLPSDRNIRPFTAFPVGSPLVLRSKKSSSGGMSSISHSPNHSRPMASTACGNSLTLPAISMTRTVSGSKPATEPLTLAL